MSLLSRLMAPFRSRPADPGADALAPAQWLVIGLGNPGGKYAGTRHNIGYLVTDRLVERTDADALRGVPGTKAQVARVEIDGHGVLLVRSTTYMNLSGKPSPLSPPATGSVRTTSSSSTMNLTCPSGRSR